MFPIGTVIDKRYRLERVLGAGGMGVVFAATQLGLDRQVAVKVVRAELMTEPRAAARLVREARAIAALKSPHVARVIDVGTHEDIPFFVMEMLHGTTVHELVSRDGPLPVEHATDIVIQACHALAEAHRHGIVHRDVKPSNLFLANGDDGETVLKLIDFGVSKARPFQGGETSAETQSGALLGSPSFMSPEHVRSSSDVDARTDIWSLGIILYFLLSGKKPFEADSLLDLMTIIVHEPAPRLKAARSDVPDALDDAVRRCLEKSRHARYATTAELARALAPFASPKMRVLAMGMPLDPLPVTQRESGGSTPTLVLDGEPTGSIEATMPTRTIPPVSAAPQQKKGRRGVRTALALAGVLASVGLGYGAWTRERPTAQASTPPAAPMTMQSAPSLPAEAPIASSSASASTSTAMSPPVTPPRARPRIARPKPPVRASDPSSHPKAPEPELPRTPD